MLRLSASAARLLIAVASIAACGGDPLFDVAPDRPMVECADVPEEQCRNAVTEALANPAHRPAVVAITIHCSAPSCTEEEGDMVVTVRLADGTSSTSMSAWALAPAAAPGETSEILLPVQPTCAGLPLESCHEFATEAIRSLVQPAHTVVAILVRCAAAAPCDATRGAGTTDVTFRDGTHATSEWGYEAGP